jgi:hypothetical protein
MAGPSVADLIAAYREGADGTSVSNPRVANRWQRKMHASYKRLRETAEGREAIIQLVRDPSRHVRCWAGAHSLQWRPVEARRTLEELRDSTGPCSFDAKITLEEFDAGRLTFDY